MPPTINANVGDPDANSYVTEDEVDAYFDARIPLAPPWVPGAPENAARIVTAAKILDAFANARRILRTDKNGMRFFYTARQWTGSPATADQALAWPRINMYDSLGRAIPADAIPRELKDAQSELAGQLAVSDPTADNAVAVLGVTSVKAGSVAVTFKEVIDSHMLPDFVLALLPASWLTDEVVDVAVAGSVIFTPLGGI